MTRTRWIYVAAAIGAALLLSAGQGFADKGGNRPGGGGGGGEDPPTSADPELVFVELGGNGASLVVADANGGNRRVVLSSGVDRNALPTWSPDGTQIAFRGTADGEGLYVVNVDGTGLTRLVDHRVLFHAASWSPVAAPDGKYKIAFADYGPDGMGDIWMVNPDGTGTQNLTGTIGVSEIAPTWAPDATRIAMRFAEPGATTVTEGIMVVTVAAASSGLETSGTASRPLQQTYALGVQRPVSFWELEWARRHDWIVFRSPDPTTGLSVLYKLDLATPGSASRITTQTTAYEDDATWSPDDSQLVYEYVPTKGKGGLHVVGIDGSGSTSLGLDKGSQPGWRP